MNDRGTEGREKIGGKEEGKSWGGEWRERKAELDTVRDGVNIEERMWGRRKRDKNVAEHAGKSGSVGQWREEQSEG